MKTTMSIVLALLLNVLVVPGAHAVDEGQTVPKLNSASLNFSNLSATLVPLTNGSGNVKGVECRSSSQATLTTMQMHFYVDGSSARTITLDVPTFLDSASKYHTGVIPMNIRFDSSIKIDIQRSSTIADVTCMASWGLD